jgi:hypothetical protein
VEVRNKSGAKIVTSAHTSADGGYHFRLRPGVYTLVAVTPNALPRCSPVNIIVRVDHPTRAAIPCDTGIR